MSASTRAWARARTGRSSAIHGVLRWLVGLVEGLLEGGDGVVDKEPRPFIWTKTADEIFECR